jgi:hypothetical protein
MTAENNVIVLIIAIRDFLEGIKDVHLKTFLADALAVEQSRLGLSRSWPAHISCRLGAACNAN